MTDFPWQPPASAGRGDRVGIITGLAAEAALAGHWPGADVVCGAGRADRAAALATALAARPEIGGLVSFGIAGGLAPGLGAGMVIIADAVVAATGDGLARWPADPEWTARLAVALATRVGLRRGLLAASSDIVVGGDAKRRLHQATAALAVDMETLAVAQAATAAGLPWVAVRAVADPAEFSLPPAALLPLSDSGQPRLLAVLAAIARQPGQIGDLVRLGGASRRALAALARGCR